MSETGVTGKPEDESGDGPKLYWIPIILIGVVAILAVNWWWLRTDLANRGTFGDMFGGVNALFSGFAFTVLAFTLLLQRYELKLQRKELAETRIELSLQRKQMEAQAATQKLQQFEATFFQLVKVHGDMVTAMDVKHPRTGVAFQGRDCFSVYMDLLKVHFRSAFKSAFQPESIGVLREAYETFYAEQESEVGHYFRHLYHIVKFIDENAFVDRLRYRGFLRAQLSANELALLFYNCLSHQGYQKFKPLVEKYGMLKHLPSRALFHEAHKEHYDAKAFLPSDSQFVLSEVPLEKRRTNSDRNCDVRDQDS